MKREGLTIAVILLFIGLAVSPSIYATENNQPVQTISDDNIFEYDGFSPVQLVFLLIQKLLNHEQIQTVDSVVDVEQLAEGDVELSGIFEELMSYSCGCEDSSSLEWNYPVICFLLGVPYLFCLGLNGLLIEFGIESCPFGQIIESIAKSFNCPWAGWL